MIAEPAPLDDDQTEHPSGNYVVAHEAYTAAGWRGVLPLPSKAKQPPPKGCTGSDGRWPSVADCWDWKLHRPADCNVALRLPENVAGLDIDQYAAKLGWSNLEEYREANRLPALPPTWRSSARDWPSGVRCYRIPAGVRLRGEAVADVETIQHHHRYAVVWPSVHPSGELYRWYDPSGAPVPPGRVPQADELPELPPEWVKHLRETRPEPIPVERPSAAEHREPEWHPTVIDDFDRIVSGLRGAPAGSRHEKTRGLMLKLCRDEQDGLAGSTAALDRLGEVFVSLVKDDRPNDAWGEWQRMLDGGRHLARTTTTRAIELETQYQADYEWLAASLPEPSMVNVTPLRTEHLHTEPVPSASDDPCESSLIVWADFWRNDSPVADFLVEPLLARGRGHAIYARAKLGKSLLLGEVGVGLATGRAVLDQPAGPAINVVYFDLEMTEDDVRERLGDLGYGPNDDLSHFHYYLLPRLPPLDTVAGGAAVEGIATKRKADLVVFDTMSRVIEGPEDKSDTFRAFYQHTGSRLKRLGMTYARLDHSGKDPAKGQRGSSAKADDVDVVWEITPADNGVKLRATHRRMSWVPETVTLRRETDPLRHVVLDGGYPAGTRELADLLDSLRVPLKTTYRDAGEALRAKGHRFSNQLLGPTLKFRRQEADRREQQRLAAPEQRRSKDRAA
jgi:hypothetical protein